MRRVEVFDEFAAGLADVEDYERLSLLFWLHQPTPPHDPATFISPPRDVFATHSPSRPNPLGLTIVRLIERQGRHPCRGVRRHVRTPTSDS